MKKLLFTSALFITSIVSAATPIDGWYGSAFGGYAYLPDNLNKWNSGVLKTHANYTNGYNAGGSFGFKSTPLRYEGELTYVNAKLQQFKVNGISQTGVTGYTDAGFAMANIYYDFAPFVQTLQPFLGLGIGYGYLQSSYGSTGPVFVTRFKPNNWEFAYQGIAGLAYNFSESWSFNISYRYIATTHADNFGKVFQGNLANLALVYRFDGNIYK